MNEFWECQSCLFVGSLNMHGKCPRCDSAAVMSQEVLIVKVLENERKRREAKSAERIAHGWKTRKAKGVGASSWKRKSTDYGMVNGHVGTRIEVICFVNPAGIISTSNHPTATRTGFDGLSAVIASKLDAHADAFTISRHGRLNSPAKDRPTSPWMIHCRSARGRRKSLWESGNLGDGDQTGGWTMSVVDIENLGTLIDRLDNLAHALKMPLPDMMHVSILRESLPELVKDFKAAYVNELHENPWEV